MVKDNRERFEKALEEDLGRPYLESHAYASAKMHLSGFTWLSLVFNNCRFELASCMTEALDAHDNVQEWAKPEQVPWTMKYGVLGPTVLKEPKGVVLIIRHNSLLDGLRQITN